MICFTLCPHCIMCNCDTCLIVRSGSYTQKTSSFIGFNMLIL